MFPNDTSLSDPCSFKVINRPDFKKAPSSSPLTHSAGDQGPHVGRELQDHDGGRAADSQTGAGQPAGQVPLRLQPRLVPGGNHNGAADG